MPDRTDAEIVAALRRELDSWRHAPECLRSATVECSCGLDSIRDRLWPTVRSLPAEDLGWQPGKFMVRHHERGDLVDGEAMVLVPDRDPAAVASIVAYAAATPDAELATQLRAWMRRLGHDAQMPGGGLDPVPSWVVTLAERVRADKMGLETALFRIAGLARGKDQP